MSKQEEEAPKGLKADLLEKERELIRLKADLEETKASNKRLSTRYSKLIAKEGESKASEEKSSVAEHSATEHFHAQEEPKAPPEPSGGLPPAPGVAETKPKTHEVKSWMPRFCPDKGCGMKNPEFKDEVQCAKCKIGLGAKANALENIGVCPNCGLGKDNGGGWEYVPGSKVV